MKLLFIIGTLGTGGKERRMLELLKYLKLNTSFQMLVVLRRRKIDYPAFNELDIPYKLLTEEYKSKDLKLHWKFYKICHDFKPDIIHAWGNMPAFVSLLAVIIKRTPLINSQITSAPPFIKKWSVQNLINRINFKFSDVILSNSRAGLKAHLPPEDKSKVIYNGINLERFENLTDVDLIKKKYHINTKYSVVMVGSFTKAKNHGLFLEIAKKIINSRKDISFICVGDGKNFTKFEKKFEANPYILFTGKINDVEALVNACDIGVLFSPYGEGISNAITEYMALGKPVIANDAGGTNELVQHGVNGFLVTNELPEDIAEMIVRLIDAPNKRKAMGITGRRIIVNGFNIDKMGREFMKVYKSI